jgi:CHAD domain-containing protein
VANGKWITGLTPDLPAADAARHVLTVRLEGVRDYLPGALHKADEDVEYVHQLRVSTRRAGAALRIFRAFLPDRAHRAAKKALRRLRQAAGAARDWDVFLTGLHERVQEARAGEQPGLDCLLGYVIACRSAAQAQLQQSSPAHLADFERLLAETVAAVQEPSHSETLLDLAQPMLLGLLRELDEAAAGNLEDYGHLHQVRIVGKRLRYAMEVFADCFAPPFREEMYPAVEAMQEILGRANDSHVAAQRLAAFRTHVRGKAPAEWKRLRPGVEGLLRFHQRRLPQERKRFLKWWKDWQASSGEAALQGMLLTAGAAPA